MIPGNQAVLGGEGRQSSENEPTKGKWKGNEGEMAGLTERVPAVGYIAALTASRASVFTRNLIRNNPLDIVKVVVEIAAMSRR